MSTEKGVTLTLMDRARLRVAAMRFSYLKTVEVALPCSSEPVRMYRPDADHMERRGITARLSFERWRCVTCSCPIPTFDDESHPLCPTCDVIDPELLRSILRMVAEIAKRAASILQRRIDQQAWSTAELDRAAARLEYQKVRPSGNARDRRRAKNPARQVLIKRLAEIDAAERAMVANSWRGGWVRMAWNP